MLAAAAVSACATAQGGDISGAGATFPYPIYSKWADAYKTKTGVGLNYQSIGSGGGIKQIKAKTVTFGASDMPLKPDDLTAAGLLQFPMIIGGVVPVVNIKGIAPGSLLLDGATLASIYLGDIAKWDDPRIKKLNPKLMLPGTAIAPIYRSDGSGTNFLFSDYLSKQSANFKDKIGANTSVQWPVGIGAKGNEGVANMTTQTDGAVGYVEYAYAKQNKELHAAHQQGGQSRRAECRVVPGGGRQRGLGRFRLVLRDSDGSSRRRQLADHRSEFHSSLSPAGRRDFGRRGLEILRMGLQGWRQAGRRPRLRAAAGGAGHAGREELGLQHYLERPSGLEREVIKVRVGFSDRIVEWRGFRPMIYCWEL